MGASSRSPSPITMVPRMGTVSMVLRMAVVAFSSASLRSPWPMVWAEAMAAFSTTRRNSSARSLSMFWPKLLARAFASVLTSVAIYESSRSDPPVDSPRVRLKTIAHHALYIGFGQAGGEIHQQALDARVPKGEEEEVVITFPPMPQTTDREPAYKFTEEQVAARSQLARQFIETRRKLNANVEKADNYLVKRFYNVDHNTYLEGAIPAKYKELLGLVVSAGLRCDDCINYHIIQSYRLEASGAEQEEALNVALVVGGSIVIPHLRRAYAMLEELYG